MIEEIFPNMKRYIFADTENSAGNISNFAEPLRKNDYISADIQIVCIIGGTNAQNEFYEKLKSELGNQKSMNLTPIRISDTSPNAADMVLTTYLGIAISRNPFADFIVVSNDKDYSSVIKNFSNKGIRISIQKIQKATQSKKAKSKKNESTNPPDETIKKIADNILATKQTRPKTLNALTNRIKQYHKKYKFSESNSESIANRLKKYLEDHKKITVKGKTIRWL